MLNPIFQEEESLILHTHQNFNTCIGELLFSFVSTKKEQPLATALAYTVQFQVTATTRPLFQTINTTISVQEILSNQQTSVPTVHAILNKNETSLENTIHASLPSVF